MLPVGADVSDHARVRLTLAMILTTPAFLATSGCDTAAKSVVPMAEPATIRSEVYETCAATDDCVEPLRCVDETCLLDSRSRLGDYHAAAGRRALAQGELEDAAKFYNQAVTEYEKDKRTPPADLFCEQGVALTAARDDRQMGEAAARVLHRCLLGVPPGSAFAQRALDSLAVLSEVGLDATLLARAEPADLYLTGQPAAPDLSGLKLKVSVDGSSRKKSIASLVTVLGDGAAMSKFAPCWLAHWKKTKVPLLKVEVPLDYRFRLDEDDEARDKAIIEAGSDSGTSEADKCVGRAALEIAMEAAKGMRDDTRWKKKFTISLEGA